NDRVADIGDLLPWLTRFEFRPQRKLRQQMPRYRNFSSQRRTEIDQNQRGKQQCRKNEKNLFAWRAHERPMAHIKWPPGAGAARESSQDKERFHSWDAIS